MKTVATRDVRALVDVIGAIEYDPRRRVFGLDGLMALCKLVGADWVTYVERPWASPWWSVAVEVGTRPFIGDTAEIRAIYGAHRLDYARSWAPTGCGAVLLHRDVTGDRAWRRTAIYKQWCRAVHLDPQARVSLEGDGSPVQLSLLVDLADDAGWSFGDRERTILELVRPAFLRPLALAETARARQRALGLTSRELEVLGLVADGLTNREIATRLFVAPTTIRSHLENAFAKVGAHTRTEAVARLREISGPAWAGRG